MTRRRLLGAAAGIALLAAYRRPALAASDGERRLSLYNPYTDERFEDVYWCDGDYVGDSLKRIDWLMRDLHRDAVIAINPDLVDLLHRISHRLETRNPFHILSGYRTADTNRLLRRKGVAAAPHSEHVEGKAADIRLPGVSLRRLHDAAVSLKAGGVGFNDRLIHVDVGPQRVWSEEPGVSE